MDLLKYTQEQMQSSMNKTRGNACMTFSFGKSTCAIKQKIPPKLFSHPWPDCRKGHANNFFNDGATSLQRDYFVILSVDFYLPL